MQLNEIFNAEDIEVLFAQWENVTGVKPLLLDSDGSVAIGEGEASEYRDVIKAGIEIAGYLSYAKKEDAEDENEAKSKIAALTIVLTQHLKRREWMKRRRILIFMRMYRRPQNTSRRLMILPNSWTRLKRTRRFLH